MANLKITELDEGTTIADDDVIPFTDISDTSMSATGTTKKIQKSNLVNLTTATTTNLTGLIKGNGSVLSVAVEGTDYEGAITAGTVAQYWRGDKSWQTLDTDAVAEATNLYYTDARFNSAFSGKTTTDLAEGTNLYYTSGRFDSAFSSKTTDNLTEGSTNFYWTQARFESAFIGQDTNDLSEGSTNLYFTNARVIATLSAISPMALSGAGVISIQVANTSQSGYLTNTDWNTFNNKESALTKGNLTTTTTGLAIGSGTNAVIGTGTTINADTGYGIPTTTQISNWDTAYGWGNHAGLYDLTGTASGLISTHESTYNHSNYNDAYSHKTTEDAINGLVFVDGAGAYSAKVIGTDVQAYSSNLNSLAGLTYASASFVKMTGANTFSLDTNTYLTTGSALLLDQTTPESIINGIPLLIADFSDFTSGSQIVNKEYVDQVINFEETYFFNDTASDIGGIYCQMTDAPTGEAESSFVSGSLGAGDGQALYNFATNAGIPGTTIMKAGIYKAHIHAKKASAGGKPVKIYYEIYTRTSGGVETLRTTSEISEYLTTSNAEYELHATLPADVNITSTDRRVIKWLANVEASGTDAVITLYAEGTNASSVSIPTTTEVLSSVFVRQDGTKPLTANWDAGSYKITAQQLESDIATGTAPLIVASTTAVSNLNADLLDGQHGTYYVDIVNDTTPQLGGDLSSNGSDILMADNDKVIFGTGSDLEIYSDGTNGIIRQKVSDTDIEIYVNDDGVDTCAAHIQGSTTNVGIGTCSPVWHFQTVGATNGFMRFTDTAAFGSNFIFARGRNTEASPNIVQDGDKIGTLGFLGYDGSSWSTNPYSATIVSVVNGTPGAGDVPGDLYFQTKPSGGTLTERMRITSDGNVGIGTNSPQGKLHLVDQDVNTGFIADNFSDDTGKRANFNFRRARGTIASPTAVQSDTDIFLINGQGYDGGSYRPVAQILGGVETYTGSNNISGYLSFYTRPDGAAASIAERMRITGAGNVGFGVSTFGTNATNVLGITADGTVPSTSPAGMIQIYADDSSDGATNATLAIRTEQSVEAIGTFTASHKLKIWINGVEYWISLDQV